MIDQILESSKKILVEQGCLQPTIIAFGPAGKILYLLHFGGAEQKRQALNGMRVYMCADQITEYFVSMESWIRYQTLEPTKTDATISIEELDLDPVVADKPDRQEAIAICHVKKNPDGSFSRHGKNIIFKKVKDKFVFEEPFELRDTLSGDFFNLLSPKNKLPKDAVEISKAMLQAPQWKQTFGNYITRTSLHQIKDYQ